MAKGRLAGDDRGLWRAFLDRFPENQTVDLILPDLAGIARGKRLTTDAFAAGLAGGMTFATSVYGVDTTGANVAESGLIWEEGDADRPLRVDLSTLCPVPWRAGGAQALAGLCAHDGRPFFADPRAVLARVARRFEATGLRPVAALELEFYLLDRGALEAGEVRPARQRDGRPAEEVQVYGLQEVEDRDGFIDCLLNFAGLQGLPVKSAVAEYAPGQYEINLGHLPDPVRVADHAFMLKRAVKAAARASGLAATFMAKPFADQASSGMHVHLSLLDGAGGNLFAEDEARMRHAIGGLQTTMAEAMLVFAPNANSYRRLRPKSYAPLAPSWGHNNRTVALRVPTGPAGARRIEHRAAGADANPYLVLAAVLAGIHHGLEHALDPGPPVEGDAYAQVPPSLPRAWDDAIAAFDGAGVLPGYLGADCCRVYRALRAAERDRFSARVTPTEIAWYLRAV